MYPGDFLASSKPNCQPRITACRDLATGATPFYGETVLCCRNDGLTSGHDYCSEMSLVELGAEMSGFMTIETIPRLKCHFLKQTGSECAHEISTHLLAHLSAEANSTGTERRSAVCAGGPLDGVDAGNQEYF